MTPCTLETISSLHHWEVETEKSQANLILDKEDFYDLFLDNPNHVYTIYNAGKNSVVTTLDNGTPVTIFVRR